MIAWRVTLYFFAAALTLIPASTSANAAALMAGSIGFAIYHAP